LEALKNFNAIQDPQRTREISRYLFNEFTAWLSLLVDKGVKKKIINDTRKRSGKI